MWTIIKIDKKKFNLLKSDFEKKTGEKFTFYKPKLKVSKYLNNKLINRDVDLLGNYIFCYSKSFKEKRIIDLLKFSTGLKYFLNGFLYFQNDIKTFIEKCKNFEDHDGSITSGFAQCKNNHFYEFLSGPFVKKFFKIINFNDNNIKILLGSVETQIKKNKYLFHQV